MRKIFLTSSILVLILFYGTKDVLASIDHTRKEFTQSINKEFDINNNGSVNIHNRYGRVKINTWDNNKVKIEIFITVNAKNETTAQTVFDRINVNFSNSSNYVNAETSIKAKKKSWISWWGGDNCDYTIDYEVFMPKSCHLEVKNKYGDTFVQTLESSAEISVAYGNVSMDGVQGALNLKLAYGNATIANAGKVNVQIKYSKIRLKKTKDISLQSKYSKVNIEKAKDIKSISKHDSYTIGSIHNFKNQGRYDNIDIDSAKNLTIVTKYTDLEVGYLQNSCHFDFKYGGADIDRLEQDFSEIILEGSYADFKFVIPSSAHYKLSAYGKYAGIRFPAEMDVVYEKEKGSVYEVEAYKGSKNVHSLIKAKLHYGGLRLR